MQELYTLAQAHADVVRMLGNCGNDPVRTHHVLVQFETSRREGNRRLDTTPLGALVGATRSPEELEARDAYKTKFELRLLALARITGNTDLLNTKIDYPWEPK
jgi:hypothetical protein